MKSERARLKIARIERLNRRDALKSLYSTVNRVSVWARQRRQPAKSTGSTSFHEVDGVDEAVAGSWLFGVGYEMARFEAVLSYEIGQVRVTDYTV